MGFATAGGSDVEAELDDVAVFDGVFLAFDADFAGDFGGGFGAGGDEVVVVDDFGGDEAAFEIRVDDAGGCGGFVAGDDGPGAGFLDAGGEVGAESQEVIDATDEVGDAGIGDAHFLEEFIGFLDGHFAEFFFDAGGDDDGFGAGVFGGEFADAGDLGVGVRVCGGTGEFVFADVAGVDGAFGGEEEEVFDDVAVVIAEFDG